MRLTVLVAIPSVSIRTQKWVQVACLILAYREWCVWNLSGSERPWSCCIPGASPTCCSWTCCSLVEPTFDNLLLQLHLEEGVAADFPLGCWGSEIKRQKKLEIFGKRNECVSRGHGVLIASVLSTKLRTQCLFVPWDYCAANNPWRSLPPAGVTKWLIPCVKPPF